MQKKYQNKLSCIKSISKLSKKRRAYAILAIRAICGEKEEARVSFLRQL